MYILRSFFFFLSPSSGAAPYERGGRRPLPEVLTAEIFPAPRPLRRARLRAGHLMWPLTPSVHGSPLAGVRVAGQRTAGVGAKWSTPATFHLSGNRCEFTKCPFFWARYRIKKTLTDGRIGWLCASVKWLCGKSCVRTHSDKRKKKKSRALRFKGRWHSGSKMSVHTSGSFCVSLVVFFYIYIYIRVPFQ